MPALGSKRASLLVEVPPERVRVKDSDGRSPRVGDVVHLDQGFTSADGRPMVLAYFQDESGDILYEVEIYESEIGPDLPIAES